MTGLRTADAAPGSLPRRARLAVVVAHEARLARRYRIVHAAAFVTAVWVALVLALPAAVLPTALPLLLFAEATTVGLFFIAGLALFERDEGTDRALDVAPVAFGERLAGRLVVLAGLAAAMGCAIAVAARLSGLAELPHLGAVVAGVGLASLLVLLVGHLTAARVAKVTSYIIAVQAPLAALALPLLGHLGWVETPLWWLLPTHGSLVLLGGAVEGLPSPTVVAGALAVQVAWIAALGAAASAVHRRRAP